MKKDFPEFSYINIAEEIISDSGSTEAAQIERRGNNPQNNT